jgi:hypothetical protein
MKWSKSLLETTADALEHPLDHLIPLPDGNVALKNIDGRYSVIKYADIFAKKFNVDVLDHDLSPLGRSR